MNRLTTATVLVVLVAASALGAPASAIVDQVDAASDAVPTGGAATYSPIYFEPNRGQAPDEALFIARGGGQDVFLTRDGFAVLLREALPVETDALESLQERRDVEDAGPVPAHVVRVTIVGADPVDVRGRDALPGVSHYLTDREPGDWQRAVPHYARVVYEEVLPGVDVVFYGTPEGRLEYDFVVAPGANAEQIVLRIDGHAGLVRSTMGELVIRTPLGDVVQRAPVAYQQDSALAREPIAAAFSLDGDHVRFELGAYDSTRALVIDPVLTYSSFLGGSGVDNAGPVALDATGRIYVPGLTSSSNFPAGLVPGPTTVSGGSDAFLAVFDPTATILLSTLYLGGSGSDHLISLRLAASVGASGLTGAPVAYLGGVTFSQDMPVTPTAYQDHNRGNRDWYVAVVEPFTGTLLAATYLGSPGRDHVANIDVDRAGNIYMGGVSQRDFPTTVNAFDSSYNGGYFDHTIAKLDPTASSLLYATHFGGSHNEYGGSIAVDAEGYVHVAGYTLSCSYPVKNAHQTALHGCGWRQGQWDTFTTAEGVVVKLTPDGTDLVYATRLGGSERDVLRGPALDSDGNLYVGGYTRSNDFPTTRALQARDGSSDAVIARFAPDGELTFSTLLGGSDAESGSPLPLPTGDVYLAGWTNSPDFPLQDAFRDHAGREDAFLARLDPDEGVVRFSLLLGGAGVDSAAKPALGPGGMVWVSGHAGGQSADFPTTRTAHQCAPSGGIGHLGDAFLAGILDAPLTAQVPPC